ncbi:hypothetical protein COCSADRAFT_240996 [Bipolaris sorokiniana ND90Pr]|uniref:Uncharacterized protein n=1 Tax=Cochliobolus sativus (strain ND90Pr / ATCC 201652) TaxID=665912 RepID=M2RZ23_COCSN|nr:uncharacterized protein COCSADRAFT_240996 [Bipolaris sorokiniana ND90Pr]EMD60278.1 hypothetical protein COCSADRAFT_240996 [Bipolaris sorokiniana ND90Pr]
MPTNTSQAGGVTVASNRNGSVRVSITRTFESGAIDEAVLEWVKGQNCWNKEGATCSIASSEVESSTCLAIDSEVANR